MTEISGFPQQMALRKQCSHPSGEFAEITGAEMEQSVLARFARMVALYSDKLAVVDQSGALTYGELDRASNRVARALQQRGGQSNQPVAIVMESGTQKAAAMYGATKAGMCYAVLPPETPKAQLSFILQDLGNPFVLTDENIRETALPLVSQEDRLIVVGEVLRDTCTGDNCTDAPSHLTIRPEMPYYIRYTSGSTGRPKGVLSTHRDFLHSARSQVETLQLCSQDRRTSLGNYHSGTIATTLTGATFFEPDIQHAGLSAFAHLIAEQAITVAGGTVTAFRQLIRSASGNLTFPHVRVIELFGEPATPADLLAARGIVSSQCIFSYQYGTTESYTNTTFYASLNSAANLENLPTGYPVESKEILLQSELGNPVAAGEIGTIIVRSRYLPQGYWNRPQLTRERFRPDPDGSDQRIYDTGDLGRLDTDGCLHHMGRKDQQVKIRGHRVEMPVVEIELMALDGVKMADVAARPGPDGDLRLVAYIVPAKDHLFVSTIRQALGQRLPQAMVPAVYVFLENLPLTTSLKVDRRALPDPGHERPRLAQPYVEPRTPVEDTLAHIWAEVLGLEAVGIRDNFLDLGGNSLLASQIVTRAIKNLRVDVSLAVIFAAPTVEDMALAVTQALAQTASDETIEQLLTEIDRASPSQPAGPVAVSSPSTR